MAKGASRRMRRTGPIEPGEGPVLAGATPASREERLRLLRDGEILGGRPLALGSNGTFQVRIAAPGALRLAVYKPRRGESPLWDFPYNDLFKREEAAYALACLLGWDFVPETVIRDGPFGIGSGQRYIPGALAINEITEEQIPILQRFVAFDEIANNADRKATHVLQDGAGRIWGIDHGLCFHEDYKMRSGIAAFAGRPLPAWLRAEIDAIFAEPVGLEKLRQTLAPRLHDEEVEACIARGQRLLIRGKFPQFNPRRVPWGW